MRQRFFEQGEVRLAILSLLREEPKNGYQLMKDMQDRSGGSYKASAGSIYPTLQQLEADGLVTAELKAGRRLFQLTALGQRELKTEKEAVRRIWDRAQQWEEGGSGPLAEIVDATMRAAKSVMGDADREEKLLAYVRKVCKKLDKMSSPRD